MIYPEFLKEHDTIGVTAPSDGITDEVKLKRLDNAIKTFEEKGFNIKETPNVRCSVKGRSSTSKERASELESLYEDKEVNAIITSGGGDFLLEMLSELDFNTIKDNPKWLQGYSDPTGLLFTITTNIDIATIYADNFKTFGMEPWHKSLENNLEILKGNMVEQTSFSKYEEDKKLITGLEPFNLTKKVYWKNLNNEEVINIKGRMIGGCLDLITELFGTRFDKTKDFLEKYKDDGIIWYFDVCELSSESLIRTLWKLKDNGYFKYTKGILFSRVYACNSYYDISYEEAIYESLKDLNIPIIINADIGHVSPRMTIINGAIATITSSKGKAKIKFTLK